MLSGIMHKLYIFPLLICIVGCVEVSKKTTTKTILDPSGEVFRKWKGDGDYYALLEIVDAYIDPFSHKATKADVLKYIGKKYDPDYPNAGPKMLIFPSSRRIGYGSYLVVYFDDYDNVREIGWVSE